MIQRLLRPTIVSALSEARVVCVLGPRQAGKTTLVRSIAENEYPAHYVSLDDPGALDRALDDPTGFVSGEGRLVIDEVQRAPELLLAIKRVVDSNNERGQFLLTGSANILTHPRVADALPGRVDYLTLWPFSQKELSGSSGRFLENALVGLAPEVTNAPAGRAGYAERVVRGGFAEVAQSGASGRGRFFTGYVDSILGREVSELAAVKNTQAVGRVLRLAAARSAALTNFSLMGRELGIDHKTVAAHLRILEQLFLVVQLPAWHPNLGHRVVRTPKLHVADTGMLCSLLGADVARVEADNAIAGSVFESFVVNEVVRLVSASDIGHQLRAHHYRDRQGHEVDLVVEHANGDVICIEVKASATPRRRDLAGLTFLRDALGERFRLGLLLHLGEDSIRLGDRIHAVPLASLWSD